MAPAQIVQQTSFATLPILCALSTSDEIKLYASYKSTKYSTCTEGTVRTGSLVIFTAKLKKKIHKNFKEFGKCKFQGS